MIRGVIFDVDGVLLDSMPVWEEIGERYLKTQGKEAKPGLRDILFPMSLEQAAVYLIREYGLSKRADQVVGEVNDMIRKFYAEEAGLKNGVRSYLEQFQKEQIPMAIATSSGRENVSAALGRLSVLECFQALLTCSEVGSGKDRPKIYLEAARAIGTRPEETWVFEDACHALLTAKRAGFRTVAVYDRASRKDLDTLKANADVFLPEYGDARLFLKRASE